MIPATLDLVTKNALQVNSAEDYISRLRNAPRRNQELQPVTTAIADQFIRDSNTVKLNPGKYDLIKEYGVTKQYHGNRTKQ